MTLHDFTITGTENKEKKTDIPVVDYTLKAKTYRYVGGANSASPDTTAANGQGAQ